jgi:hypothetical protein
VAKIGLLVSGTVHAPQPKTGGRGKEKSSWLSQQQPKQKARMLREGCCLRTRQQQIWTMNNI